MAVTDDEELVPDEALDPDAPVDQTPDDAPPEDPKYADLRAQIEELKARPTGQNAEMSELVALGKQFLASQQKPGSSAPDPAALEAWGRKAQELAVTGDAKDFGSFLLSAMNDVSTRNVNEAAQRFGTPLVEKAGQFAVQAFLSHKRDEVGDNGAKLHSAIAKKFALTDEERSEVATASPERAERFLNSRYKELAGDILLSSSTRARPRNLASGGTGGSGGATPGLPPALQAQAEAYWPDPKVRAEKIKALLEAGEAS